MKIQKLSWTANDVGKLSEKQLIGMICVNILSFVAGFASAEREKAVACLMELRRRNLPEIGQKIISKVDDMLYNNEDVPHVIWNKYTEQERDDLRRKFVVEVRGIMNVIVGQKPSTASDCLNWYKLAKEVSHDYSWVYLNLPKEVEDKILGFGKEIDSDDLYEKEADDGLETEPHITLKYALLTDDASEIKERLSDEKGGKVYIGESSIFEGDKYDVVKIEIESDDLKRLHDRLNELPHEDKFADYKAHATIAYVKKGCGKKYVGKFKVNKSYRFKEVFFGDRKENSTKIKLANGTWYKLAQKAPKSLKFPYQIFRVVDDEELPIKGFEATRVDAINPRQALEEFFRKYPRLRDYAGFFHLIAKVDNNLFQERQRHIQYLKEKEDDILQDAWWNK